MIHIIITYITYYNNITSYDVISHRDSLAREIPCLGPAQRIRKYYTTLYNMLYYVILVYSIILSYDYHIVL